MCATAMEVTSTSTSSNREIRKIRKPLMEKKRRARINDSLDALQRLLSEAEGKDLLQNRQTKLEKADILEMTVRHLRNLNRQQKPNNEPSPCHCLATKVNNNSTESAALKNFENNFVKTKICAPSETLQDHNKLKFNAIDYNSLSRHDLEVGNQTSKFLNSHSCGEDCYKNVSAVFGNENENINPSYRASSMTKYVKGVSKNLKNTENSNSIESFNNLSLVPVKLNDGTLAFVVPSAAGRQFLEKHFVENNDEKNHRMLSNNDLFVSNDEKNHRVLSNNDFFVSNDEKNIRVAPNSYNVWRPWF